MEKCIFCPVSGTYFSRKRYFQLFFANVFWLWYHHRLFSVFTWVGQFLMNDLQLFLSFLRTLMTFLSFKSLLNNSFHVFLGRLLGKLTLALKVLHLLDEAPSSILFRRRNHCTEVYRTSGQQLCWKETPTQVFSCEYCKIFKSTCFEEHLSTAASEYCLNIEENIKSMYAFLRALKKI